MACNCQEIAEQGKQKVEESLAMNLLKDVQRSAKRWFMAWIITFLTLLSVLGGIVYIVLTSEFEVEKITQDGYGVNNYIGDNGEILNGTADLETEK